MSRSCAEAYSPSLPIVRVAQPMPAQLTALQQWRQRLRRFDRLDDLVGVGYVTVHVGATDLLGDRAPGVVVEVGQDDLDAARGECAGGRFAETRGAAGDDG